MGPIQPAVPSQESTLSTRQLIRAAMRLEEYRRFGPGTHTRPLFDAPRKNLRAVARARAARAFRAARKAQIAAAAVPKG